MKLIMDWKPHNHSMLSPGNLVWLGFLWLSVQIVAVNLFIFGMKPATAIARFLSHFTIFLKPTLGLHTDSQHVHTCVRSVAAVANRSILPATCLPRAITAKSMLKAIGIDVDICIGVGRDEEGFSAHAWIELDSMPISESPDLSVRFSEISRI